MRIPTRESHLPELRLPEISRDGIAHGLSEIHAPDLSKLERPNIEMPDIDLSRIDFPRIDVAKTVVGAATAVGLVRRRRPRWPFLLGAALVAGLTGWALMNSRAIRERLDRAVGWTRDRMDEMRTERDAMDPVAPRAAATALIDRGSYAEGGSVDPARAIDAAGASANDYPEDLGAKTDVTDAVAGGGARPSRRPAARA